MSDYLNFIAEVINGNFGYEIVNNKHEHLGRIEKVRVGQWMSWCLFLNPGCYLSASCIDEVDEIREVREKIRSLNNHKVKLL